jgi:UDP-N-acetylglucosamine 2-epimerase
MIDFLILYELKNREIENVILLGNELKKRGYSVEYLKYPSKNRYMIPGMKKKARVVLTSALYDNNSLYVMVYRCSRAAKKIINLQWEQIWTNQADNNFSDFRFPHQMAKEVVHVCWGEHTKEKLLRAGIKREKVKIAGPLHMDFLRPNFKKYYKDRETLFREYDINTNKITVLFISSFSYATLTEDQIRGLKTDLDEATVDKFQRLSVESQKEVISWIDKLLQETPNINFIYRKHPAENDSKLLRQLMDKYEGFKAISDYSVKQWILTCDKIYTWYSTSIGEVYFAHKPCVILRPIQISNELEVSIMSDAEKIIDYDAFKKSIHENYQFPIGDEVMRKYYSVDVNVTACQRLGDLLEEVLSKDSYNIRWDKNVLGTFSRRLWKDRAISLLRQCFHKFVKVCNIIKGHYGIELPKKLENKVHKYEIATKKILADSASKEEIRIISEKLWDKVYH